jgi:RHS repeat-associated protein
MVTYDGDTLPFGSIINLTGSSGPSYEFAGMERDDQNSANLDYAMARYYNNRLGRLLSSDEFVGGPVDAFSSNDPLQTDPLPYANIVNPQSLNKYAYTYNNPVRYIDPNGHDLDDFIAGFSNAVVSNNLLGYSRNEGGNSDYRIGQAVGDFVSVLQGEVERDVGGAAAVTGAAACATGVGCPSGGAALAVGGVIVAVHGVTVEAEGGVHLVKAAIAGSRPGQDFTPAGKREIDQRDQNKCQNCGRDVRSVQNKKGEPTPADQRQRHHIKPKREKGGGTPENAKTLCPECHKEEHRKLRCKIGPDCS